jgi:hypothetical protein
MRIMGQALDRREFQLPGYGFYSVSQYVPVLFSETSKRPEHETDH